MKRDHIRLPRRPRPEPAEREQEYYHQPSRLDVARLLLEVLQFAAEVYDRWRDRQQTEDEAEMSPAEAREYAAEILAAADKAEANDRDGGEEWNAP